MSKNEQTNEQLVDCLNLIACREEAALARLYDATSHRVYGVALRILQSAHCAEEVVSDVYLHAWENPATYDRARGPVVTWLLVLCRSRALDALRSRSRRSLARLEAVEEPVAEMCDPQDLLEAAQRDTEVRACVAALQPVQRQLVALAFFRGYSHSEIATFTGIPLGTVKTTLRAAIGKMRGALEGRPRALSA